MCDGELDARRCQLFTRFDEHPNRGDIDERNRTASITTAYGRIGGVLPNRAGYAGKLYSTLNQAVDAYERRA